MPSGICEVHPFSSNGVFKIYYLDVNKYASNNNIYTIKEDTLYRGSYSSVNEMLNKSSGYEIRKFNDSILIAFSKYNNKIESIYIKRDSEFGKRHLKGIEICEINDLNYEAPPIKKCEVCNGTGLVKFMHCESDLEAILSGYEPYTIQKCYKCDGEGK